MTSTRRRPAHLLKTRSSIYPKIADETFDEPMLDLEFEKVKKLRAYMMLRAILDLKLVGSGYEEVKYRDSAREWFLVEESERSDMYDDHISFQDCCSVLCFDAGRVLFFLKQEKLL